MSDATTRLSLPLLAAAQAQKHVTHNEALYALDALVQLSALARHDAPPPSPPENARYIVSTHPSGAFAGHAQAIAVLDEGAWVFFMPQEGWICWLSEERAALVFHDGDWNDLKPRSAERLGIAVIADDTNRLAVASPAILFNHAGAGTQVKINKADTDDTASLLFQTGFSGRAEIGLPGEDILAVKVSPDGTTWREAARFSPSAGRISGRRDDVGSDIVVHVAPQTGPVGLTVDVRSETGTTLADFALQTELHTVAFRNEGRSTFTLGGAAPEFQVRFPPPYGSSPFAVAPNLILANAPLRLKSFTLASLPSAVTAGAGALAFATDASGGAVPIFSDGTNWRRVMDRSVVS